MIALAAAVVSAVVSILVTRRRTEKKVSYMLDSLEDNETNFRFGENRGSSRKINRALNRINGIFQKERAEIQEREAFYGQMLDQVTTGIVVVAKVSEEVLYTNRRALEMLRMSSLSTLRQLKVIGEPVYEAFSKVEEGKDRKALLVTEIAQTEVSLKAICARIRGKEVKIITVSDISEAIEENESESWTRLIRVLTHEIMNTVTPIASLSETLSEYEWKADAQSGDEAPDAPDLKAGLETISSSSRNLIKFVNSYRDLTHIPVPVKKAFYVREMASSVLDLSKQILHQTGAEGTFVEKTEDVLLYADESQISQILINLVKNAVQAGARHIEISTEIDRNDCVLIDVSNDGTPISQASQEEIFIPFFTTRPEGNGIGLSLSRQIMRLHGGSLRLSRSDDEKTVFTLIFR